MKSVLIIFFLSLVADCLRFPISRNELNIPSIEVSVTSESVNSTVVWLDLSVFTASRLPASSVSDGVNEFEFRLGNDSSVAFNTTVRRSRAPGILGIGPLSHLVSRFGSVGVFANELVLNQTQSEFDSRCVAESIMNIPIVDSGTGYSVRGTVALGVPAGVDNHLSRVWIDLNSGNELSPVWLPSEISNQLITQLTASGMVLSELNRLSNCTLDAIHALPDLVFSFESLESYRVSLGSLQVSPSNLFTYNPVDNTCIVHYRTVVGHGTASLPILAIPGMNVYIAHDSSEIRLCDDASV
jgi:hypothetical protein